MSMEVRRSRNMVTSIDVRLDRRRSLRATPPRRRCRSLEIQWRRTSRDQKMVPRSWDMTEKALDEFLEFQRRFSTWRNSVAGQHEPGGCFYVWEEPRTPFRPRDFVLRGALEPEYSVGGTRRCPLGREQLGHDNAIEGLAKETKHLEELLTVWYLCFFVMMKIASGVPFRVQAKISCTQGLVRFTPNPVCPSRNFMVFLKKTHVKAKNPTFRVSANRFETILSQKNSTTLKNWDGRTGEVPKRTSPRAPRALRIPHTIFHIVSTHLSEMRM